jgi:hypothetical protein
MAVGVSSSGRDSGCPCVLEPAGWLSAALFGNILFRVGVEEAGAESIGGDVCSRTGLLLTAEVSVRAETDLGTVVILVAAKGML